MADTDGGRAGTIRRLVGILLLFAISLLVGLQSGDRLRYEDEEDYDKLARSIVDHHSFAWPDGQLTMLRPPGYPAVIAPLYAFTSRPLAAKVENAFFLALAAALLGLLVRRIEPRAEILLPYLLLAYPLLIYAASLVYPQILGCLLLSFVLLQITGPRFTFGSALLAGLAYGLLMLAIPAFLMLLPLIGLLTALRGQEQRWPLLRRAAAMVVVSLLVVGGWTARNYATFGVLVPVSANNGINLLLGNSAFTTPNSGVTANEAFDHCAGLHPGLSEYEADRVMRRCALDWITGHPAAAARLYLGKVVNYFNFHNELATQSESAAWRDWLLFVTYYPLLALAVGRLMLVRRLPLTHAETCIYALYFLNAFAAAIFFARLRFRIPFDFLLIGANAAFLARLWSRARANRRIGVQWQ